jgi:hypothetical protein
MSLTFQNGGPKNLLKPADMNEDDSRHRRCALCGKGRWVYGLLAMVLVVGHPFHICVSVGIVPIQLREVKLHTARNISCWPNAKYFIS